MLDRIYIKECLSFKEIDLDLEEGLNVFTGPSGAGKSILMQAILSLFSLDEVKYSLGEVSLVNSDIEDEVFDILKDDDIVIKTIKKDKVRFFLNNQSISKKNLNIFSKSLIKHLNLKDTSDFDSSKLIEFLDRLAVQKNSEFKKIRDDFDTKYKEFTDTKKALDKILEDESKLEDLKDFAKFEIEKIENINPKEEEYEELNNIKKKLSKKEKIQEALKLANPIFEYGSIKEALKYKEEKKKELEGYENISFEKTQLEKKLLKLETEIEYLAKQLTIYRKSSAKILNEKINYYLEFLYLSNAKIDILDKNLDSSGCDEVVFELNNISLKNISSGEFNRLRLALLTSMGEFDIVDNGILFLDEIDANLSGKESDAIAKVLVQLSKSYQIFAISHQPQLTSNANVHFLVDKKDGVSSVKKLDKKERIDEIARMISGEEITQEALSFAKNLLKD